MGKIAYEGYGIVEGRPNKRGDNMNQYNSEWTTEIIDHMLGLVKLHNLKEVTRILNDKYNTNFSYESVKSKHLRCRDKPNESTIEPEDTYKSQIDIQADGSHKSDRLLRMNEEQTKDVDFLLESHGYDKTEWELVSARNNIWNSYSKQDGIMTMYASKITVKPRSDGFDFDKLLNAIENRQPKEPIRYKEQQTKEPTYLEIPLFDLHFGIADIDYYKNTLQDILEILQKQYYGILIIVGQDVLHNDNFKGQTANGTPIDKVDMVKAIDDAELFYETIIDQALKSSTHVTVAYNKGNHDESMAYMLTRALRNTYRKQPNITFDIEFKERKAYMLGLNFIGTTHGDKNRKNVASNFSVEFPAMWSKAVTREVHMGHLHRKRTTKQPVEITIDEKGVIVRELGTGNKTDGYHDDNGFNMAHKEFEIFEYAERKKKHIHYV